MPYKGRAPFQSAAFTETQRNFTYFDKSLTSGLTDVMIESPGDFLYIDQASTGVVRVELNMRQGGSLAPITLAAGGSIECDFSSIKLTADAQLNKSVRIVIGNGARIKGGANVNAESSLVSVVDGSLSRTLASEAFFGMAINTATAANAAHVQLWNPADSGKNIYLPQFLVTVEAAQVINTCIYNNAYANAMAGAYYASKLTGGASPVAQLRNTVSGSNLATSYNLAIGFAAAGYYMHKFAEPVVIKPGYGFGLLSGTLNTRIFASFEWYEK